MDKSMDISMDVSKSFKLIVKSLGVISMHRKTTEENVAQGNEKVGLDPLIRNENKYGKWIRYDTIR